MARLTRFLTLSSMAWLGLSACSTAPREGPPAPIVQVTPREGASVRAPAPAPRTEQPATPPPQPVKRETQVYAYRDPGTVSEPVPAPPAPATAPSQPSAVMPSTAMPSAPPAPAQPPQPVTPAPGGGQTAGAPAQPVVPATPARPAAPPPRPPEPQVAKADPRSALPAAEIPSHERRAAPPAPALPPSNFATPSLPPAAAKLASQAEQQRQSGDYAGAAASLERSLRIAPRESYLWNRLARVRLEQGQAVQAGNLAARANDLAGSKEDIKRDNWRIIAESKRRAGDLAGASEADQRAGP